MRLDRKICARPEIKMSDTGAGEITFYGSTFGNKDRGGDVVDKGAFTNLEEFKRDGFLALGHDWDGPPIGYIKDAKEDDHGLLVTAAFHDTPAAQQVRQIVKERLAAGKSASTSMGYVTNKHEFKGDSRHLKDVSLFEMSIVNVPMNAKATVVGAKSATQTVLPIAPRETAWDAATAENRLRLIKAGRYTGDAGGSGEGSGSVASDGAPDWDLDGDAPDIDRAFLWTYQPTESQQRWGVYKLPVADVVDGSLQIIGKGVEAAAEAVQNGWQYLGIPDADLPAVKTAIEELYGRLREAYGDETLMPPWGDTKADLPIADRDREWDASAAEGRMRDWAGAKDKPNGKYARGFMISGGDKFSDYKLPFCDVINGTLTIIPKAVFAIASVLDGGRGGVSGGDHDALKSRVAGLYGRMREKFNDDSIVPPWEDKGGKAAGPLAGLTFDAHTEAVLAAVSEYTQRAEGLVALRTKSGRTVSAATREKLARVHEHVTQAQTALGEMIDQCEPPKSVVSEAQKEYLRSLKIQAELATKHIV